MVELRSGSRAKAGPSKVALDPQSQGRAQKTWASSSRKELSDGSQAWAGFEAQPILPWAGGPWAGSLVGLLVSYSKPLGSGVKEAGGVRTQVQVAKVLRMPLLVLGMAKKLP